MSETEERDNLDRRDMLELAGGNDLALNAIMDRHSERVVHFIMRVLGDRQDAMDLGMEAFVRVYEHRKSFNPRGKFTTWLYAISTNLIRDRLRWKKRRPEIHFTGLEHSDYGIIPENLESEEAKPNQVLEKYEEAELVRKAISSLPEDLRLAIVLTEYESHTHLEASVALGCSSKAVEMKIYRAKKSLRKALEKIIKIK